MISTLENVIYELNNQIYFSDMNDALTTLNYCTHRQSVVEALRNY